MRNYFVARRWYLVSRIRFQIFLGVKGLTKEGGWVIVNFRGAARQNYSIKIVSGYIKSQEDFGIIMELKGLVA